MSMFAGLSLADRAVAIGIALLLDVSIGDPRVAWHPVRLIGNLCAAVERATRARLGAASAGVLTWIVISFTAAGSAGGLILLAQVAGRAGGVVVGALLIFFSISARDLASHARQARDALKGNDLASARERLSFMVSRDTTELQAPDVTRAVVESVSENLGDGVIAPLLYAALLGPAGAFVYRAVNTMDAMFGYRNEKYVNFGRFAARADDIANLLPARLSGLLVCLAGARQRNPAASIRAMARFAPSHESPNAGYPEAATAAVLGIRLGGPGMYHGKMKDKAVMGEALRDVETADIDRSVRLMWIATAVFGVLTVGAIALLSAAVVVR